MTREEFQETLERFSAIGLTDPKWAADFEPVAAAIKASEHHDCPILEGGSGHSTYWFTLTRPIVFTIESQLEYREKTDLMGAHPRWESLFPSPELLRAGPVVLFWDYGTRRERHRLAGLLDAIERPHVIIIDDWERDRQTYLSMAELKAHSLTYESAPDQYGRTFAFFTRST